MLVILLLALATGIEDVNVSPAYKGQFSLVNRQNKSSTFLSLVKTLHEDKHRITKNKVRTKRDLGYLKICQDSLYKPEIPVKCYQCWSNVSEPRKEPLCDDVYWKIIRHSEKAHMRVTCDILNGKFCMKITRSKFKERTTERGCFGKDFLGPVIGTTRPATVGCTRYTKDGYITRACLCDTDFCNATPHLSFTWNIVYIALLPLLWNTF